MMTKKKIVSIFLTMIMVLGMAVSVSAASGTNAVKNGKITIDNAVAGEAYTIYKILDLESYSYKDDTDSTEAVDAAKKDGAYSYTVAEKWKDFVSSNDINGQYLTVDDNGYVTWVKDADAAVFAKKALAFAKDKSIANDGTVKATKAEGADKAEATFTGLSLGYYLVDSSLGTLCSLDTTNNEVTMREKNEAPSVEKKVKVDNENWRTKNNASIGDTVDFKTVINVKKGAKGYVLHDKMSEGLTLKAGTISVNIDSAHYSVNRDTTDGCAFEITFAQEYLDTITKDTTITVTYSAILNDKAEIYKGANTNDTWLKYGANGETVKAHTDTYTYKFDLVKTKEDNTILKGAEFKLYDAKTDGTEIALVKEADGSYRVATAAEKSADGFAAATIEAGSVTIKGLGTGTYWLEETKAPAGYNKLKERIEVKIEEENVDATIKDGKWIKGGVQVINKTGVLMPSTGGMGTTMFYVIGGILVLGAAVLFVTKRRMKG